MDWKLIDSDAKDGAFVLLYFPEPRPWQAEADGVVIGFWSEEAAAWFDSEAASNALNEHTEPTHWAAIHPPAA